MKRIIDDRNHKIIYIEYQENIPFNVVTIFFVETSKQPYWRPETWDFFANEGDVDDMYAYSSGSGGSHNKIPAPQYIDGYLGASYWMADGVEFEGIEKNIKRLERPLLINAHKNPFKYSEITHSSEYCDRCEYYSTEFCHEHKYEDDDDNVRYKDDDSYE